MRRIRAALTYANVMSTLALFAALGGSAFAASKFVGSGGTVRICISSSGGLKALKSSAKRCAKGTTLVTVNEKGVTGAQGDPGRQGPPGTATTVTTASNPYAAGQGLILSGSTFSADLSQLQSRITGSGCVAGQALEAVAQSGTPTCTGLHAYSAVAPTDESTAATAIPPGTWLLLGQMTAGTASTADTLHCAIDVNGVAVANAAEYIPASTPSAAPDGSLSLMGTATTTAAAGTSIETTCTTDGSAFPNWSNGEIVAVPLAALN